METVLTSLFPTCIHLYVCVLAVMSSLCSGAAKAMAQICMSRIRRQVDILSEAPGTESAVPKENHTLRVLLTQKPQSSTTITDWQQPAQHNTHRQRKQRQRREEGGGRGRERIRVKDSPVCIKLGKRAQIKRKTDYICRDPELNFSEMTGHYVNEWDTEIVLTCYIKVMWCSYLHKISIYK